MTLGFSCRLSRTRLFSTLDNSKKCITVFSLIKVNIYSLCSSLLVSLPHEIIFSLRTFDGIIMEHNFDEFKTQALMNTQ